jgi:bacterial/archaeal transporter family protein
MISWVTFALLTGVLWSVVSIFEKHIIGHEYHDPIAATVIKTYVVFAIFACGSFFAGKDITSDLSLIIPSLISGALLSIAVFFYYKSLQSGEVSRVVPVFSTAPIFTLLFGAIFLKEHFSVIDYIGILTIAGGSMAMGMEQVKHKLKIDHAVLMALLVAFFSSMRTVIMKNPVDQVSVWPLLFWVGFGGLLFATPLLIIHYQRIEKYNELQARRGIWHFVLADILDAFGHVSLFIAIGLGSVSLVTGILHTKALIIFLVASIINAIWPNFINEKISRTIIAKKALGTALIIMGAIMLVS